MIERDVEYHHGDTRMLGRLFAPDGASRLPTVLMIHDAFGLGEEMMANARRLVDLGCTVFAADVWGERTTPATQPEIGPLIGGMAGDRARWLARLDAAHMALGGQAEADPDRVVAMGFCFGGSSALEHLRAGTRLRGVIAIHAGLDLLAPDWSQAEASASVLICTGADDPMATAEQRAELQAALSGAGIDWQVELYSDTTHAFTSLGAKDSPKPELFAYNARSAARAWRATEHFLTELFTSKEHHND